MLHYARWMAGHERPYLDRPEILEFPTETWDAQDMRKSEVFDLAALHAASAFERAQFSSGRTTFSGSPPLDSPPGSRAP